MILYEDSEIIVCHKPSGVPVQSASVRVKDMVSMLKNQTGGEIYVVHRLDQPVEGVIVFAKTKRAAADLSRQITDGSMKKIYHAVVELSERECLKVGRNDISKQENDLQMPGEWHTLVDYLIKDARENRSFVVDDAGSKSGAKRAELRYRILKCWSKRALVEIDLKTGRHHQIRVQMAHAGMPLVGDQKYNKNYTRENNDACSSELSSGDEGKNLALCAVSLTFRHPVTKKKMAYEIQPQFHSLTK